MLRAKSCGAEFQQLYTFQNFRYCQNLIDCSAPMAENGLESAAAPAASLQFGTVDTAAVIDSSEEERDIENDNGDSVKPATQGETNVKSEEEQTGEVAEQGETGKERKGAVVEEEPSSEKRTLWEPAANMRPVAFEALIASVTDSNGDIQQSSCVELLRRSTLPQLTLAMVWELSAKGAHAAAGLVEAEPFS